MYNIYVAQHWNHANIAQEHHHWPKYTHNKKGSATQKSLFPNTVLRTLFISKRLQCRSNRDLSSSNH